MQTLSPRTAVRGLNKSFDKPCFKFNETLMGR